MRLGKSKSNGSLVGLDLGAGGVAATELPRGAPVGAPVHRAAVGTLEPGTFAEGEILDAGRLAATLAEFFEEHELSKEVRLGIANQKVTVRMIRMPFVEDPEELATAVRFKAQDEIPMPLDQAVLDHRVVAHSTSDEGARQMDVIVVAARREMVSSFVQVVDEAGLKPVGIDLAAFALIRALVDRQPPIEPGEDRPRVPGTLYCGIGDGTNMAFARGRSCLFTRVSPVGVEEIASDLARRAQISLPEARQALVDVGLTAPLEELGSSEEIGAVAGTARRVLEEGVPRLLDQIRPSINFYSQQPDVPPVEDMVVGGVGASIAGLPDRLAEGLGLNLRHAMPEALAGRDPVTASRLAISYGLALEE